MTTNSNLKALILVAGRGSRQGGLTDDTNKSLLIVGKNPILWYSIKNLIETGVENICLVTGYKSRKIHTFIRKNFPNDKITFIFNKIFLSTNSIYSYYLARNFFYKSNFFRLDGDLVYSKNILRELINSNKKIVAAVEKKRKKSSEELSVSVGTKNRQIKKYCKTLSRKEAFGDAKGIEFVTKEASGIVSNSLVSMIQNGKINEYAEMAYQNIINNGGVVNYSLLEPGDYWCDVDTNQDLETAIKNYSKII